MANEVAKTIVAQLGNRALFMLGAQHLLAIESGLQFAVRGSKLANRIVIKLDAGTDTYTVQFWKVRGASCKQVSEYEMVYVDSLHRLIESETGLRVSL